MSEESADDERAAAKKLAQGTKTMEEDKYKKDEGTGGYLSS